ncbi:hypothetical protein [Sulfitobacter aestuariivivens]|uniref:Ferrochelatase n=1 Tax=Sulfitobacter aestuariivivens TaxID=2766981 RepID=A0A927D2A5_9RHOB|nr:hypothetical protein [Sulfitobacter aestuariivivens]MBD3663028.1 hypothetical protein [Sulfitobacter aestuariivivens]
MKKSTLAIAVSAAFFATGTFAGSVADPVIEAPVIVEDATSSSTGTSLVLALALLMSVPVLTD